MDTVQGMTGPGSRDGEKFPTRTLYNCESSNLPHACKRACKTPSNKRKEKRVQLVTKRERGAPKGKEGSIKTTNSYSPSKVAKEWGNIPISDLFYPKSLLLFQRQPREPR